MGKTIQIFLPDSNPSGIRIAELTSRVVQAVAVPKTELDVFFKRPEALHVSTYLLFGGDDESTKPIVYIGQTEDLRQRLRNHDANKEFWSTAVVLVSRTHSFTQAHIRWLEWRSISAANNAKRYRIDNGNAGSEPFVTEPIRADLMEIFETSEILLESLGFPVFRPYISATQGATTIDTETWFLTGPGADAKALFTDTGFVVLKGSRCRGKFTNSAQDTGMSRRRERMILDGILTSVGSDYMFAENFEFASPSGAAVIVLARHANGWEEWRNSKGASLKEIKRPAAHER